MGRRRIGRMGSGVWRRLQIIVLFLRAGHPHSVWTRSLCLPLHLSLVAPKKNKQKKKKTQRYLSDWESNSKKRQRGFVCILWPILPTTNTLSALTPCIQQESKWCSNASEARSNQKHIELKWEGWGWGGATCRAGGPQGPTRREAVLCQLH